MKTSRLLRLAALPTVTALAALALAGCSSTSGAGDGSTASSKSVDVVASTDVWGSVAQAVGGSWVNVTSIIDDPDKDPHEYQADAHNQLALSKAVVVIENGAGYDDFVDQMLKSSNHEPAAVLTAADISGYTQGDDFNEHLWYDFPTVEKVATRFADALEKAQPKGKADIEKNLQSFDDTLQQYEAREDSLKQQYAGDKVTITEPVPLYMLNAIGLDNVTPQKFSEAIENDTDVAPAVLKQTLDLYASGTVKMLAYNEQTTGPQTQAVLDAAKQNDVAVVPVTETLPAGDDYLGWMSKNLDAIEAALKG